MRISDWSSDVCSSDLLAIAFDGLPKSLRGFSIVQITDLHVGPTIKAGYVQAVVDAANRLRPDIIALTGDLVDGGVERLGPHIRPLGPLDARLGVYAVPSSEERRGGAEWASPCVTWGLPVN